jgi:hypothetical protein
VLGLQRCVLSCTHGTLTRAALTAEKIAVAAKKPSADTFGHEKVGGLLAVEGSTYRPYILYV